ncbi:MAG: tRNA lysidine(34) synthetase TilS [Verrucomicrobia bacterium]|nr:tRNA lysidine(34) synthetase TilS [Verrucomicrobiota bacterium]
MSGLLEETEHRIHAHQLLSPGQRVVIAVSGGLDSMVLLTLLHRLSAVHQWDIAVAHFNHKLRDLESDADAQFVHQSADQLGLPFFSDSENIREKAKRTGDSVEMAARSSRQQFLTRVANDYGAPSVALAHHADDQTELFFIRLLRGAGIEGLGGMRWRGNSPSDPRIDLVRPLLSASRIEIRDWASAHSVDFRDDSTNREPHCLRNQIRIELLPLLRQKYQPGLNATILRTMDLARADSEYIRAAARTASQELGKHPFQEIPVALQRDLIVSELHRLNLSPDYDLVEFLRTHERTPTMIRAGTTLQRESDGTLQLEQVSPTPAFRVEAMPVDLPQTGGTVEFAGFRITWACISKGAFSKNPARPESGCECFDAERVGPKIVLRHWKPGDRFQPIGMPCSVKLQDLLTNSRVPREERHRRIVGTTQQDEVFWVQGLRIGERFKAHPAARTFLEWNWQPIPTTDQR